MNQVLIEEKPAVNLQSSSEKMQLSKGIVDAHYYYEIAVDCALVATNEDTLDAMILADASPSFQFLRDEE